MNSSVFEIINTLKKQGDSKNITGMARFGIRSKQILGVRKPILRSIAKEYRKDHEAALELWKTEIHEARILAVLIDDPLKTFEKQINCWSRALDNWDLCDQFCMNLVRKTPFAHKLAQKWTKSKEEYVKRAGFVTIATLAVHDNDSKDSVFMKYLRIIKRESKDDRNFVKKAVNWALREIGKRSPALNRAALHTAKDLIVSSSKTSRWIASDAIRELKGEIARRRAGILD